MRPRLSLALALALCACSETPATPDAARADAAVADLPSADHLDAAITPLRDAPPMDAPSRDVPSVTRDREPVDVGWSAMPSPEGCTQMGGGLCFVRPTETIRSGRGPLDFSCGETPDATTARASEAVVEVQDFVAQEPIPGASLALSWDDRFASPLTGTANDEGIVTLQLPIGVPSRLNWRVTRPGYADTYTLASRISVESAQHRERIFAVPYLFISVVGGAVGVPNPSPRTGVVGGAVEDCDGNPLEHAVVTLSSTSSVIPDDPDHYRAPTFVPGSRVFYFDDGPAPAPRSRRTATSGNGLFAILDAPETVGETRWYLQAWGHRVPGVLRLMGETRVRVVNDAVMLPEMRAVR